MVNIRVYIGVPLLYLIRYIKINNKIKAIRKYSFLVSDIVKYKEKNVFQPIGLIYLHLFECMVLLTTSSCKVL